MTEPTGSPRAALEGRAADTAPYACSVLAGRFVDDVGEWEFAVVNTPLTKPFTHWWPLPDLAADLAQPAPPTEATEARALLQSFLTSLTGNGKNNPRTLSINHDKLAELVAETRHVLSSAATEATPPHDGLREKIRCAASAFIRAYEVGEEELTAGDLSAYFLAALPTIWEVPSHKTYPCQERPITPEEAREIGRIEGLEEAAKIADAYEQHTGNPAFDAATDVAAVSIGERIRTIGAHIRTLANGEPA